MSRPPLAQLAIAATLGAAVSPAPALAKWETAYGFPIAIGGRCDSRHDLNPTLRASAGRPFEVPSGFNSEIEIYGQGIDLSPTVTASGLAGLTATMPRKVGGAENAVRGCGTIGSVVVRLEVVPGAAAATGHLTIGSEIFPLRIVNASINSMAWSEATIRRARGAAGSTGSQPLAGQAVASGQDPGCGPVICPPRNGGAVASGSSGTTALVRTPDYPSGIGECIDGLGGAITFNADFSARPRSLTLTLPRARGDAELACLVRPAIFEASGSANRGDIGGFRAGPGYIYPSFARNLVAPRYTGTTTGLAGPVPLPMPDAQAQTIAMTRELAASFVGERQITLSSTAPGANPLTLILRSVPYNGVRSIQGVPFTSARLTSTFEARFDFLAAFKGPETVAWRIGAVTGAAPQTCFAAISGTLTTTTPVGKLPLTATEAAGCAGSRFTLQIAPTESGAGVFSAPFVQTAIFTLPARSLPQVTLPPR